MIDFFKFTCYNMVPHKKRRYIMLFLNEIYDVSKAIKKLYEELYTLEIKGMKNSKQYQENLHLLIKGLNF